MAEVFLPRQRILEMLAEQPRRIGAAAAVMGADALRTPPGEGEWSATEILAHLRACADVWGRAIGTILVQDRPTIRAINPRTWIRSTEYLELDFEPSFAAFVAQRADLLATLGPVPLDAWLRTAVVTGAGPTLERNIHWYAHGLATHERSHVKEIERRAKAAP